MMDPYAGFCSSFWGIFSFSFVVALTGAMAPGPLLTYTIIEAAKEKESGYRVGLFVILGHAAVEMILILFLIAGFSYLIENPLIIKSIGMVGGMVLATFGLILVRDLMQKRVDLPFFTPPGEAEQGAGGREKRKWNRPVLGGALISMSNPYWWIWWGTIGIALMSRFEVSLTNWPNLVIFFLGHEAGDLLWYGLISTLAYTGVRFLNKKVYYGILGLCGAFMVFFGAYLGISPLLF